MSTLPNSPAPVTVELDPKVVQEECLQQLDAWAGQRRGLFSWPMDRVANKPYGYTIHCSIVEAWYEEDRQTEIVEFHRQWLTDITNIEAALTRMALFDKGRV